MTHMTLEPINRLFQTGTVAGLSDGQLLERFLADRDASAFDALVKRHGPMVLGVCRAVLRDKHDAEDAFQATFLILVRKAGTIRGCDALGGWLYRVARRVSVEANRRESRRRKREGMAGERAGLSAVFEAQTRDDEVMSGLHEEISRLPEAERLSILLCDFQGVAHSQAAEQLSWSERTLRRRLASGRERLRSRLTRRGLLPAGLAVTSLADGAAIGQWNDIIARVTLDGSGGVASASSTARALAGGVIRSLALRNLAIASGLALMAGLIGVTGLAVFLRSDEPPAAPNAMPPVAKKEIEEVQNWAKLDVVGKRPVRGRVVDPDGKPVAGASIYVQAHSMSVHFPDHPAPAQSGLVAKTDADGRFLFDLDKGSSDWRDASEIPWHRATIAAEAPGFGPAFIQAGTLPEEGETTWKLTRDDIPIRGRLIDPQGKGLAGVKVVALHIRFPMAYQAPTAPADYDAMLAKGELDYNRMAYHTGVPWLGDKGTWTTDADGRFEIKGVGRDQAICLEVEGSGLERPILWAMARPAPAHTAADPAHANDLPLYPAEFVQVVGPSKPITGVVKRIDTDEPLSGLLLVGSRQGRGNTVRTRTDERGRFRLDGLPKTQLYSISVEARTGIDPFLKTEIIMGDTEGLEPIEVAIALAPGVVVTGRLVDKETRQPLLPRSIVYRKAATNSNGGSYSENGHWSWSSPRFRITVPPGRGLLTAYLNDFDNPYAPAHPSRASVDAFGSSFQAGSAYRIVDIPADAKSFEVELEATRGKSLKGRVLDPQGQPVRGVLIHGQRALSSQIIPSDDGSFEVLGLESGNPRLLLFAHQGRRLVGSRVITDEDLAGAKDAPLVVRLTSGGTVRGRLMRDDQPAANARISVKANSLDGRAIYFPRAFWPFDETATDSEGRFAIAGLIPGVKTSFVLEAPTKPGHRFVFNASLQDLKIEAGMDHDLGDVTVREVAE
ncbi:sigma-70 family RNA polymerase sigma factor [Singulisphaera sp. PoT]|uniref:sigma-70 family RNA polymerase sigma factor n=1 Tax=Singulisphaera sp. PoT TaxID=3411797 RepID=UPI003BF4715D